jgi:hypothetical protein
MRIKDFFSDFDVSPISASPLHVPVTISTLMELQERNEAKRQQSLSQLGSKWLLHPDNKVQRKEAP